MLIDISAQLMHTSLQNPQRQPKSASGEVVYSSVGATPTEQLKTHNGTPSSDLVATNILLFILP